MINYVVPGQRIYPKEHDCPRCEFLGNAAIPNDGGVTASDEPEIWGDMYVCRGAIFGDCVIWHFGENYYSQSPTATGLEAFLADDNMPGYNGKRWIISDGPYWPGMVLQEAWRLSHKED